MKVAEAGSVWDVAGMNNTGRGAVRSTFSATLPTIKRLERGWQGVSEDAQAKVANALETAGVVFINGDEPGVKLRKGQT